MPNHELTKNKEKQKEQTGTHGVSGITSEQEDAASFSKSENQAQDSASKKNDTSVLKMMGDGAVSGLLHSSGSAIIIAGISFLAGEFFTCLPLLPGLVAVGTAAGALIGVLVHAVDKTIEIHNTNKAKRIIKKQAKEKTKENKKEIKKQKSEIKKLKRNQKKELKKAKTTEEKARISEKYAALINEKEHIIDDNEKIIAREKEIAKEKIRNMPSYKDCESQRSSDTKDSVADIMAKKANKIYNRKHGIKTARPAANSKQVQQQVARERITILEHKSERKTRPVTGRQHEKVVGMHK